MRPRDRQRGRHRRNLRPPQATGLLGIGELTDILAALDRQVTDAQAGPPEVTALHLD